MIKIHCSALPRLFLCGGFIHAPTISLPDTKYSSEGTYLHKDVTQRCINGTRDKFYEFAQYINLYDKLKSQGEVWIEREMSNDLITGTADLIGSHGEMLVIADLKTGFISVQPETKQLLGYAWLALEPQHRVIHAGIFQNGGFKSVVYTRQEVLDFEGAVKERLTHTEFVLGDHCQFCNRVCEKQNQAAQKILGFQPSLATLALYKTEFLKMMKDADAAILDQAKAPPGLYFAIGTTSRRSIDPTGAPDILLKSAGITMAQANSLVKGGLITQDMLDEHVTTKITPTKKLRVV